VASVPTDDPFRDTTAVLTSGLRRHPDIAERLDDLHHAAWAVVDPVPLELCRLRIAQLLGCEPEQHARTPEALAAGLDEATIADLRGWPTSSRFGPRERACLAFCEQFVIDVANLTDDLARAVSDELGPAAFADFVNALLIVEQRQRLRLAWERLLISSGSVP
jgi:alkylhydroperoxidase family enzyme